jgi:DNA polymerase-3 subunit gamma/tau
MLGLADRSRVLDLMEHAINGDQATALSEATALLEAGADAPVLLKDLMDVAVEISRAQAMKDDYAYAGPAEWMRRTQAMAQRLSPAQAARFWRLLLQGFEDCQRSPDPASAAQMVVLRLAAAAFLPSPEDAARLLSGGGGGGPGDDGGVRIERGERSGVVASLPTPRAVVPPAHDGPVLSSLRDILTEIEARRELSLKWEIERFVRPAEIRYGLFSYSAAPGAANDLSQRLKAWLESVCHVEWIVQQSDDAARETPIEARERRRKETLAAAAAHPRVATALKLFPDARLLRVEAPEPDDHLAEFEDANVIQVDFKNPSEAGQAELDARTGGAGDYSSEDIPYEDSDRESDD